MSGRRRLRNCEDRWLADQEGQRYLPWRGLMRIGDLLQEFAAGRAGRREIIMTERRIGDDVNAMSLASRDHTVFDGALLQMIEYLIAGDGTLACEF